jgi:hypothetical protein
MKHFHFSPLVIAITTLLLLLFTAPGMAQVTLSATGSGSAYDLIDSKGFGNENPDCKHPSFGPHVTQAFDNTLGKYVFVFHSHADADDDRCTNEDRVRMEIKGGSGSPAAITGGLNSFPNPFRDNNIITFTREKPAHTNLSVYDITGKQVAVLVNGMLQTGNHKAILNAPRLAAGVYTLKLTYNGKIITRKLLKE